MLFSSKIYAIFSILYIFSWNNFFFFSTMYVILVLCALLTSENIALIIKKILSDFRISKEKVVSLTTDNNSTAVGIVKAVESNSNTRNQSNHTQILDFESIGCYAHKVNLIVCDGLFPSAAMKEKFKSVFESLEPLYEVIEKIKKIVTYFHSSVGATEVLKEQQSKNRNRNKPLILIQDVRARWNSMFQMLKRFSLLVTEVTFVMLLLRPSINIPLVTHTEIQLINELIAVLKPLYTASNKISTRMCRYPYVFL